MARKPKLGHRTWRFADSGNKFDGRPKPVRHGTQKPISPALKRGVIHCSRCGSRVVSNVSNCPFCGRSLRPVYARFWFWLIVVVLVALGVILLVNMNLPQESTAPSGPATPEKPRVVGGDEDSSLKYLSLGTTIDNSGLQVTVERVSPGPLAANGAQIYTVEIEFINKSDTIVTLYSKQWMLELIDGSRLETFVGSSSDGTTMTSNFEIPYDLEANGRFSGRLYFAVTPPATQDGTTDTGDAVTDSLLSSIVYQPSALAYDEDLLVTWKIAVSGADASISEGVDEAASQDDDGSTADL